MKEPRTASTPSSRRRYDSQGRQQEAQARRRRVLDEAHRLFLRDGYAATSIDAIAAASGVSVQTVYATFTSKAGILAGIRESLKFEDSTESELVAAYDAFLPEFQTSAGGFIRAGHEEHSPLGDEDVEQARIVKQKKA